jgi:hypothetical protein
MGPGTGAAPRGSNWVRSSPPGFCVVWMLKYVTGGAGDQGVNVPHELRLSQHGASYEKDSPEGFIAASLFQRARLMNFFGTRSRTFKTGNRTAA